VIDERGGIKNTAGTVQSTYAKWEDINDAIRPVLHEHGFALSFRVKRVENAISVTGILSHEDGHSEETTLELPSDTSGSKNAVQAVGSSLSYGKRYTAMALLNITSRAPMDRDDDGLADTFIDDHKAQCQGALWVSEREWIDLCVYWPGLPPFVKRAYRDDAYIENLAGEVARFNDELAEIVGKVRAYGQLAEAA
jgi:hypothetical protein